MGIIVRVDERGRIVIPSKIRESLRIRRGARLELEVKGGRIVLRPAPRISIESLYGVAGEERASLEEIEESLSFEE